MQEESHTIDHCFKLTGIPDWYANRHSITRPNSSKSNSGTAANVTSNDAGILGASPYQSSGMSSSVNQEMVSAVCKEVLKAMQHTLLVQSDPLTTPYYTVNFAGSNKQLLDAIK